MNLLNEIRPADVVLVAQRLAGSSDEAAIRARFAPALNLLECAAEMVADVKEEKELRLQAELFDEANNTPCAWDDPRLLREAGLDGSGAAKRLRDNFRNRLKAKYPKIYHERWLNGGDLSQGISLESFRRIWPHLSKWRARG